MRFEPDSGRVPGTGNGPPSNLPLGADVARYNDSMTLRRLLLIFPAYLLGVLLAGWWESGKSSDYRYTFALNGVRNAYLQLAYVQDKFGPDALEDAVIDQWLTNSLPTNHPAWQLLVEHADLDPWGNPYRCVRNQLLDDGTLVPIGVYSPGRDGVSLSQGNDPDDLNSWRENTDSYYRAEINAYHRKQFAIQGAFIAPITYAALLIVGLLINRSLRLLVTQPPSGDIV